MEQRAQWQPILDSPCTSKTVDAVTRMGLANGVIIDPGGPGYAGSITLGDGVADPLAPWTIAQYGGTDTGQGTVVADGAELVATEGDSLLTTITQTITIPEDPSWLIFGFEAFFDETTTDSDQRCLRGRAAGFRWLQRRRYDWDRPRQLLQYHGIGRSGRSR